MSLRFDLARGDGDRDGADTAKRDLCVYQRRGSFTTQQRRDRVNQFRRLNRFRNVQLVSGRECTCPIVCGRVSADNNRRDAGDPSGPLSHLPYQLETIRFASETDIADDDVNVIRIQELESIDGRIGSQSCRSDQEQTQQVRASSADPRRPTQAVRRSPQDSRLAQVKERITGPTP